MENYKKVNVSEYVSEMKKNGTYEEVYAEKFARIIARQGQIGEKIITYSTDQNGNTIIEKVDVVKLDNESNKPGWVVTKADENAEPIVDKNGKLNQWIIDDKTFTKKYEITEIPGFFKPKGGIQTFVQIPENITLEQWGSEMNIAAGGYINITNPNDMYAISSRDFNDTYKIIENQTLKK